MAKINIDIKVNNAGAAAQIDRLTKATDRASKNAKKLQSSFKGAGSAFKVFAGNVAAIGFTKLISGIAGVGSAAFETTKELEDLRTQFEVLTGSTVQADRALRDLQQFAANTPFQIADLAKAQQRLLSFGFSLGESKDLLGELGDVAAASGTPIGDLSLIFGQVSAAGKLTGERLLQLEERAIPIGPALAKSLGVAEESVRELVSQGKVSFQEFEEAFKTLNDTGEFAFEGLQKRSRTLSGRLSTLQDNLKLLGGSIGTSLSPALKAIVTAITQFIQLISGPGTTGITDFSSALSGAFVTSLQFAISTFSFLINAVLNAAKIFNTFRAGITQIAQLIPAAFGAIAESAARLAQAFGFAGSGFERFAQSVADTSDGIFQALDETKQGFVDQAVSIQASQNQINDAIEQSSRTFGEELAKINEAEANRTSENTSNTQAQIANIQALTQAELAEQQKLEEARATLGLAKEEDRLLQLGNDQIFLDAKLQQIQDAFTAEEEAALQARINLATNETEKQRLITEAQTKAIGNRRKIQQENLDELRKAEGAFTKFEEQEAKTREANRRSSLSTIAGLQNSNNKTLAAVGKAAALTQIAIDGPQAVTKALAAFPPPFNFAAAAAVGTAVAAQAARVVGINFEDGGIVPGASFTGDNVPANVNSGEMILNREQQSQLFALANGTAPGGAGQPITVNTTVELDGEVVGRAVSQQVANGLVLGEVQ